MDAQTLTVNTAGSTTFGKRRRRHHAADLGDPPTPREATILSANVTTTTFQHYDDAVSLGADVTLTNSSATLAIDLASTVDGAHNLTVDASGINAFEGAVGGTTPLTSLTTGTAGTTDLGANVTTTTFQHYDDPVTLIANLTLTNTSTTLAIDLASTVDGAQALTVDASGINAFEGAVGGSTPLTSLTTGTAGTTGLGANVTTTGFQHYNDAVKPDRRPDAGLHRLWCHRPGQHRGCSAQALTVDTAGSTTFGAVGGGTPLTSVTTVAAGSTVLSANVTTTGFQHYNDAVSLTTAVTLTSTGSAAVDLASTVDGAQVPDREHRRLYHLRARRRRRHAADVGDHGRPGYDRPLRQRHDDGLPALQRRRQPGRRSDAGLHGLRRTSTWPAPSTAAHNLTVNTAGLTTFGGAVGAITPLTSVTTDAPGSTVLSANVTTTGFQHYNDAVSLTTAVTLTSTAPRRRPGQHRGCAPRP